MSHKRHIFGRIRCIHMVGIGGIGMSSIAEVLLSRGFEVSGSDLQKSEVTDRLEKLGARIYEGHDASHVGNADVVVHSSAVKGDDNPETRVAQDRRIPLISRAVMLGELMRMKYGIGIAGTHGKTTTTSMTGLVVSEGGLDPTIIVGGKVAVFGSNAVVGEGDVIVIEADEYDRTFLRLTPALAVITNIEAEHLDIYADENDVLETFVEYADKVPFFGAAIVCLDDPNVQRILNRIERRVVAYGTARQADIRLENLRQEGLKTTFEVIAYGQRLGEIVLQTPGLHNALNALAAVTVGLELEIPFEKIRAGLGRFTGVQRRFQLAGEAAGVTVIDDYAHHPTEIAATLKAAAAAYPDRRLIAVFQPHLYSRTRDFKYGFARSFFDADMLVITDIYGAREQPIEGVTGEMVAELARRSGHREVHYLADIEALPTFLTPKLRTGDVVVAMGAGTIWKYTHPLVERLAQAAD